MHKSTLILLSLIVAGCVTSFYQDYPDFCVIVTDEKNNPVNDADVRIIYPLQQSAKTNTDGVARISGEKAKLRTPETHGEFVFECEIEVLANGYMKRNLESSALNFDKEIGWFLEVKLEKM